MNVCQQCSRYKTRFGFSHVSALQEVVKVDILRLCGSARCGTTLTPAGLEEGLFRGAILLRCQAQTRHKVVRTTRVHIYICIC